MKKLASWKRVHLCLRCGHEWMSRDGKPKSCARCKSMYWAKPRMRARRAK